MKRLALLLLAVPGLVVAQSTSVTATITDTDGFTWNNGSYQIQFVPNPANPGGPYTWTGGTLVTLRQGSLNGSGVLSISLPDNTTITGPGTQWKFTLCPFATGGGCFSATTQVTGSSQNLSSFLSASAVGPRFSAAPSTYGYGTIEVNTQPQPGWGFYNTTTNAAYVWSGSTWVASGTGSFSLTTTGTSGVSTLSGGVLNIPHYAGSGANSDITALSGMTGDISGPVHIIGSAANGPLYIRGNTAAGNTQDLAVTNTANSAVVFYVSDNGYNFGLLTPSELLATDGSRNLVNVTALPNGTTATTQTTGDNTTKIATDAFVNASTGTIGNPSTLPSYGSLVNQTNWTSLSNYSANGTTPTVSGGALQFSGGAGTFTQSLDWVSSSGSYVTTAPVWLATTTVTLGTLTSTSFGLGVGLRSTNSLSVFDNALCRLDMSNTGTSGTLYINGPSGAQLASSSSTLTLTAGDSVQIICGLNYNAIAAFATDITTGHAINASYTYSQTYAASNLMPNAGHFAIYNIGGSETVTAFSVSSLDPVNATFAFVGDSKTQGYWQTFALAFANQYPNSVTLAGGSDATQDVLNNMAEIIAHHPKNVILNIGRNDLCVGSVPIGTVESNYSTIVSDLTAAGINVYHLVLWESSCAANATWNTYVASTYSATLIDPKLQNYGAFALAGDSIHPNLLGANLITSALTTFMQNTSGLNQFKYLPSAVSRPPLFQVP